MKQEASPGCRYKHGHWFFHSYEAAPSWSPGHTVDSSKGHTNISCTRRLGTATAWGFGGEQWHLLHTQPLETSTYPELTEDVFHCNASMHFPAWDAEHAWKTVCLCPVSLGVPMWLSVQHQSSGLSWYTSPLPGSMLMSGVQMETHKYLGRSIIRNLIYLKVC